MNSTSKYRLLACTAFAALLAISAPALASEEGLPIHTPAAKALFESLQHSYDAHELNHDLEEIFEDIEHLLDGDAHDIEEANEILEQLLPGADGGPQIAAVTVAETASNIVDQQLTAALHDGASGIAAGEQHAAGGARFWLQAFGRTSSQDARGFDTPYDADSYGFVAGVDTKALGHGTLAGLAFSYANTEVDSENLNRTNTDIDSYQITAYGATEFGNHNFVSGMLGYVWSDNENTRILGPDMANGEFDSEQIIARGKLGHDIKSGNMVMAPTLLANYANYSADDYTETGPSPFNLNVSTEDMDLFEVGVELDVAWNLKQSGGATVRPNLVAGYRYDVTQEEIALVSSFTGGGGAFSTIGAEPPQNKYNVGGGLKYFADSWELTASYMYDFMEDYDAHSGMIRAGFKF